MKDVTEYLLALDVGTTGANAMIFDPDGNSLGTAYREYASIYPAEHQVEQDADTVIGNVFEACRESFERTGVDPGAIRAVGITSHRATFGLADANGRLLNGRFIVWQDNRAVTELREIAERISADELYRISGMPLTPTYTFEKLVWFQKHRPDLWAATATVVFPADYVLRRFGVDSFFTEATNACCSGMIDVHTLDWSDRILRTFNISRSKFAPLVHPGTVLGKVNAEAARLSGLKEGTPLVCTTGDQQCAAIGAGVIGDGFASLTLGTAGLLVVGTDRIDLDKSPGLMVPSSGRVGLYELEGIQLGAASCYRWVRDQLALPEIDRARVSGTEPFELMEKLLHESVPGSRGVVFLPFLSGAGYPLWDPMAQGTFAGLRFSHTRADMIRSVMEGVTLESFDMYQRMKQSGVEIRSLTVTGGATASSVWRQTIADIFGTEIRPLKVPNATLVGAAIFAGIGVGIFRDVEEGVARMVRFAEPIRPIPENVAVFRKTYDVYKNMAEAFRQHEIFHQLVQLRQ